MSEITLRDLTASYMNIMMIAEDLDEESLRTALSEINDSADAKIINIIKVIKEYEDRLLAIKDEINRLNERKTSTQNTIDRLKEYIKESMTVMNKKKIESDLYTVTLANNAPSVRVIDEKKIPLDFFEEKTELKLDKKALKEYLKQNDCEGAELIQAQSIRVK